MTKWYVTVCVLDTIEVDAETQEEAEVLGLALFDPTANEPEVHDSWEKQDDEDSESRL
jgi:hypothetical protein